MAESVRAAGHALDLLRMLVDRDDVGVSEAAAVIGVAPSTAHRILATLVEHGFAIRNRSRRYQIDPAFAPRSRRNTEIGALVALLRPALRGIFESVGETVHLMVLVGSEVQFVDGIEGRQALRIGLRIGGRIPAYCTSGGKALLAALDPHAVDALHPDGLTAWSGQRFTSMEELHHELATVRDSGVAINRGESEAGVMAIGRAIVRDDGVPVAAFAIALPTSRYHDADAHTMRAALRQACDAAATALDT